MTTIAYRDGVMAGDRATRYGSTIAHDVTKVVRRDDGALCGTAGCSSIAAGFRRWFLAGENGDRPSLGDDKEDIHALVVRPSGVVEIHDRMGWVVAEGEFWAIGSGFELALGAMAAGASAEDAVQIAARFGIGRENAADVVRLASSTQQPEPSPISVAALNADPFEVASAQAVDALSGGTDGRQ